MKDSESRLVLVADTVGGGQPWCWVRNQAFSALQKWFYPELVAEEGAVLAGSEEVCSGPWGWLCSEVQGWMYSDLKAQMVAWTFAFALRKSLSFAPEP